MIQGRQLSYTGGPHIMLDCFDCDTHKLSDVALIYNTLETFPEKIGMTKIMDPYVFKYNGATADEWGVTGIVLIDDSHITIHTFPDKKHAFVDIFASKDFDANFAISHMTTLFGSKTHEVQISQRGSDFPQTKTLSEIDSPAFAN